MGMYSKVCYVISKGCSLLFFETKTEIQCQLRIPFFHTHQYAAVSKENLSDHCPNPKPPSKSVWNETQVHHKHWEATEHAGDGHVEFSAEDLMKQRVEGRVGDGDRVCEEEKVSTIEKGIYNWN